MKSQCLHLFLATLTVAFAGCQTTTYTLEDSLHAEPVTVKTSNREPRFAPDVPQTKLPSFETAAPDSNPLTAAVVFARELEQRNDLEKASELYLAMLEDKPNNSLANHRMGIILSRQQNFTAATEYFSTALKTDSDNAELLADYGYCRYLEGNFPEAEKLMLDATGINSDDARTQNNLGVLYAQTNQTRKALSCFRLAGCDDDTARVRLAKATGKPAIGSTSSPTAIAKETESKLLQPLDLPKRDPSRRLIANSPTPTTSDAHFDNPYVIKSESKFAPEPPALKIAQATFITNEPSTPSNK